MYAKMQIDKREWGYLRAKNMYVKHKYTQSVGLFRPQTSAHYHFLFMLTNPLQAKRNNKNTHSHTTVLCLKASDICKDKLWTNKAGKGHTKPLIICPLLLLESFKLY